MKSVLMSLALFLLAFNLCGMSSRYTIKVVHDGASLISFHFKGSGAPKAGGVEVNTFLVVKRDDSGHWDYKNPMWAFELSPGNAKPLSNVTYGEVPVGFAETTKAKPLERDVHYLAVGLTPGSGGSVEFTAQ